ncbi:hypothetical protein MUN88_17100 [Gracilibacillus caseinilyticus]|uniref:Uncharacterized protein n=1 Tax=Gracilibacillus caseinilyticus TaxID=2932256 RepID=A0ABY4EUU5_9BACI|nr:hypothetical protein [Gracilibacillus caseinilyticus]UOQ47750.1 hypothetical protein MUN88_17100 [Gracilibacillus caseinilyticus]
MYDFELIKKAVNDALRIIETLPQAMEIIYSNTSAVFRYLSDNEDKIKNFINDIPKLQQFTDIRLKNIPTNETINLVTHLVKQNKIQINEDWSISLVEQKPSNIGLSEQRLNTLIGIISLTFTLNTASGTTNNYDIENKIHIDNSTTNYYIEETTYLENKFITTKEDLPLYEDESSDEIIHTVPVGTTVFTITNENDKNLIVILDKDNQIEYSGWVDSKYITPIVD